VLPLICLGLYGLKVVLVLLLVVTSGNFRVCPATRSSLDCNPFASATTYHRLASP
jgi:hypothetical protein